MVLLSLRHKQNNDEEEDNEDNNDTFLIIAEKNIRDDDDINVPNSKFMIRHQQCRRRQQQRRRRVLQRRCWLLLLLVLLFGCCWRSVQAVSVMGEDIHNRSNNHSSNNSKHDSLPPPTAPPVEEPLAEDGINDDDDDGDDNNNFGSDRSRGYDSDDETTNASKRPATPSFFVVCAVDGTVHVVNAKTGNLASAFPSGAPLVGPSELLNNQNRIVPGLDGRLYLSTRPPPQAASYDSDDDTTTTADPFEEEDAFLQPLEITVLDVLDNPVKTCKTTTTSTDGTDSDSEDGSNSSHNNGGDGARSTCGIVTASKTTSLYALDATSGELVWQQYANGTTVVASSSTSTTVLLQREDILVQQLSTDSGHAVWNVTLGTFQALDFGESSSRHGNSESHYLPESSSTAGNSGNSQRHNGRPILMDAYSNFQRQPQRPEPPQPLPHVLFGPDGTSLTAVHPTKEFAMWNLQFPTVVASVFGLNGRSWKPLTVLDDEEESSSDDTSNLNKKNPPSIASGAGGGGAFSGTDMTVFHRTGRQGVLEHFGGPFHDWNIHTVWDHVMYWFLDKEEAYITVQPTVDIPHRRISSYQQHWRVTSTSPESFLTPRPKLALPSPTMLQSSHNPSRGLFLTWPVVVAIVVSFAVGAAIGFRFIYSRKKKRWLGLLRAAVTDKSVHFVDVDKHKNSTSTTTMTTTTEPNSTSTSTPMLRRSHSSPGLILKETPNNKNLLTTSLNYQGFEHRHQRADTMDDLLIARPINNGNTTRAENEREQKSNVDDPTQIQPPTAQHNVGFLIMDGVPLIRYSRYESEFQEVVALGKGGFGTVFRCKNALDGREYAIKKIRIDTSDNKKKFSERLQRTLREVKSLALLDHPNIVRYFTAWLEVIEQQQENPNTAVNSFGAAATSDYYLNANTTTAKQTQNQHSCSYLAAGPQFSTSDLFLGHRRPSMDSKSMNNNPLGTYWDRDDESLSPGCRRGFLPGGIPPALDDYGFTFDRSGEEEDDDNNETNDESMSGYPYQQHHYNQNLRCGSSVSADHSIHTLSERSSASGRRLSFTRDRPSKVTSTTTNKANTTATNALVTKTSTGEASKNVKHILYIQMQFCSQKTLADFLENKEARRGPSAGAEENSVDIPFALDLFLQIVQGVKHVHSNGLIHRDLKPNNCFMDDAGMIKVGDFGLSRESGDTTSTAVNDGEVGRRLAEAPMGGDITAGVGTRSYASPEQMKGSDYDSSTDIYSLGIILFELCYPMYTGMERNIVLSKLRDLVFPDLWLKTTKPAFPSLHSLLVTMLSTTPSERPTADTVARSIQSILEGFTISSLDRHQQQEGSILLRVEAKPREDVLQHTIQLIKQAAIPVPVDIVQYGLRGGTNKAIMEFAIAFSKETDTTTTTTTTTCTAACTTAAALGNGIVSNMSLLEDILLIRQVSATKYT